MLSNNYDKYKCTKGIPKGIYLCCLQETHFGSTETHSLKVKEWKNIFYAGENSNIKGLE